MDWGSFGWSEGIAGLALLVSITSWNSARASAEAARQANFLQLHNHRKELYLAFYDLQTRFKIDADRLGIDKVFPFSEHSKTCYLYVSSDLAAQLKNFFNRCWKIAEKKGQRDYLLEQIELFKKDPFSQIEVAQLRAEAFKAFQELRAMVDAAAPIGREALEALMREIKAKQETPSLWRKFIELYNAPFDWGE